MNRAAVAALTALGKTTDLRPFGCPSHVRQLDTNRQRPVDRSNRTPFVHRRFILIHGIRS